MRSVLIVGLALVVVCSGELAQPSILYGYHDNIGIPRAAAVKAAEESARNSDQNERIAGLLIDMINVPFQSVCGAVLLSRRILVTAAHCWNDGVRRAWRYEVVLGSNQLFSGGTRIHTSDVTMHPQWNRPSFENDIAIIRLPRIVFYSDSIRAAVLPNQASDSFEGVWAQAAGFGMTSDGQNTASTVLSQVNLQVISVWQCAQVFGWGVVHDSTLCTSGAGGVGICGGDSGGPLVVRQNNNAVLIGISSFVAQNQCQGGWPSAFARVTSHIDFINSFL